MKNILVNIFLFILFSLSTAVADGVKLYDLRVNGMTFPLGIDNDTINLSWKISSVYNGTVQQSYEYEIFDINGDRQSPVLKSGIMNSDEQNNIYVDISSLKDNTKYAWKVKSYTNKGVVTSPINYFHIGLRNIKPGDVTWIWAGNKEIRTPYFSKKIRIGKEVKNAYMYISGQGYYNAYIDGNKIGENVLSPLPSQSQYRVYYDVFDVSKQIKDKSRIVVVLGEGQSASTNNVSDRFSNMARSYPGLLNDPTFWVKLCIEYEDGRRETISTDKSWKWTTGPVTYNSFYGGEDVDARISSPVTCEECKWNDISVRNLSVNLSRSIGYDIKLMDTITPVDSLIYGDSIYIYDLGQNIGGVWSFDVSGDKGTVIEVNGSETLNNSDFPKDLAYGDKLSDKYTHGLGGYYERDAKTRYILSGRGIEQYQPSFFYSGFRYIQVKVRGRIDYLSVKGCTTYTGMPQDSYFECSDAVLNQLHKNTIWSIKGISQGAPMSNPNSEKYGWTGDAHLYAEPAMMLFDSQTFWEKWLNDIRDGQLAYSTGNVINTIPNYRRDIKTTSATWGAAYPLCVWYSYCFYNDKKLIEKHLQGLIDWCNHLDALSKNGLIKGVWGDHVPPGYLDGEMITRSQSVESSELVASVYYYVSHYLLSRLAGIINENDIQRKHAEKAVLIADAINNKYLDRELGYYKVFGTPKGFFSEQTVNAIPVQYGIVPEDCKKKIIDFLVNDIKKHGCHLTTGIMGTKALVDVLPKYGYEDLFMKLATQPDYPGWGFWVKKGATTHWQHWSGFPDHNHAMYGSIENFILSDVGGIKMASLAEIPVSEKMVVIEPRLTNVLDYVKCGISTIYGYVRCSWKKEDGYIYFNVEIPVGLSAKFIYKNKIEQTLKSGSYKFSCQIEDDATSIFRNMNWTSLSSDFGNKSSEGRIVKTKHMAKEKNVKTFPASYFRNKFNVSDSLEIASADLYMAGIGYHNCFLNGNSLSDDCLTPSPTSYDKTIMYRRYDISDVLKSGSNVLAISLANGFMGQNVAFLSSLAYGHPRMKSFIKLYLNDGTTRVIKFTDWKCSVGSILFDNIYAGITYDSRLDSDWKAIDYNDRLWKKADKSEEKCDSLIYRLDDTPPIRIVHTIKPKSINRLKNGNLIVDFGENISGVIKLKVNEKSGQRITVTYGEVYRNGVLDLASTGIEATGVPQMDILIANGNRNYTWIPNYTYHGFRYSEISGLSSYNADDISAVVLHNDFSSRRDFRCSDSRMNTIYDVSCRTLSGNLHGIPEDCPHREKCAWLGDAHLISDFAMQRYNSLSFWRKYCYDIYYELSKLGVENMTMVIPGKRTCGKATFDWGVALFVIPWQMYVEYGDISCLSLLYPYMKKYMDYLLSQNPDGIVKSALGDWCPPLWDRITNPDVMECSPEISASAYFYKALLILKEVSFIFSDDVYNRKMEDLCLKQKKVFNDKFYDAQEKWYGSQSATVLALEFGIVPDTLKKGVLDALINNIRSNDMHHNTGVFGSKYLYSVLSENGYSNIADSVLLNPTFPSYLYTVKSGMTTWPERQWEWNKDVDFSRSLNHLMHVGFSSYFYECVLGLKQEEGTVNYSNLILRPYLSKETSWAQGGIKTDYGNLDCMWKVHRNICTININIPKNIKVKLDLDHLNYKNIHINGKKQSCKDIKLECGKNTVKVFL